MKLGTVNPNTNEQNLTVEKPFSGYGFQAEIVLNEEYDFKTQGRFTLDVVQQLEKINSSVVLSLAYIHKDGNPIRPFTSMRLIDLLEYAQRQEGSVILAATEKEILTVIDNGDGTTTNETTIQYTLVIRGYLPLTANGNLLFNNDETAQLTVTTDEKTTLHVFTIESALASPDFYKYTNLDILEGKKEVVFDLSKLTSIMIPASALTATTEIQLTFTNGKVVRYRREDLEFISSLDNDVSYQLHIGNIHTSPALTVPSRGIYHILDVDTIAEMRITRDSTKAFSIIAVSREVVKDVSNVYQANKGLIDQTELKLDSEISNRLNA